MINIEIGVMCSSAYASNEYYDWTLSIRKKDGSEVGNIVKNHKKEIDPQFLRDYLPEWNTVEWRKLKTAKMFPQELMAECGDYQLNIIIPDKNTKEMDLIIKEFNDFMEA